MAQFHLKEGSIRNIIGDEPASGYVFDQWTGDVAYLDDPMSRSTNVTMPAGDIEVTATYLYIPLANSKYGLLYNFYAATDARNIAASGMDVPTRANFITLETSLGGSTAAGGHLKETGFVWWNSPNTGADNSSQMNVRGNGYRAGDTGIFAPLNSIANIWTKDEYSLDITKGRYFQAATYNYATSVSNIVSLKSSGFGLRLVRLATTEELLLSDGIISATYTGNDGKLYRLCKVGIQIWLADNLVETKYRNGDWIHGYDGGVYTPISNAVWAAATTEMCCAYNDDTNNI